MQQCREPSPGRFELDLVLDSLLDPLRETVRSRTIVSSVAAAEIRASELGPQAVAVGAATLVLKEALSDSRLFPFIDNGYEQRRGAIES